MRSTFTLLAGSALLMLGCVQTSSMRIERGSASSVEVVRGMLAGDSLGPDGRPRQPFVIERIELDGGVAVDILGAQTRVMDATPRWMILSGPGFPPRLLESLAAFEAGLSDWWPATLRGATRFCLLAAQAEYRWREASLVFRRWEVPQGAIVLDRREVARLDAVMTSDLTSVAASTIFWTAHSGGATRIACELRRDRRGPGKVSIRAVDSTGAIGFPP
jgi:hypothetical protein